MKDAMDKFYTIAAEEFKKRGIKDSKFLGISRKGDEWQFIYRVSSLSREIHWEDGVVIWKKISEDIIDNDSSGTSLRDCILSVMENKARTVGGSHLAKKEIMMLGEILRSVMIPLGAKEAVVKRIFSIAKKLSSEGDEKSAHYYLSDLAAAICLYN